MGTLKSKFLYCAFLALISGGVGASAQTVAPPSVVSPVDYCLGSPAAPLTATGTNLKWIRSVSSSVGGSEALSATNISSSSSNNKRTIFTTSEPNVRISSVDFSLSAWQNVSNLRIGIFNADGTVLLASSSTVTSKTLWFSGSTVTNTFNYTIPAAGTYSIGIVSGSADFGAEPFDSPIVSELINVTGTSSGARIFTNIEYSATVSSSVAPTPSTNETGSSSYQVTQTVNGVTSQPATITVRVNTVAAPVVASAEINLLQGATATALSATGSNLRWSTSMSGVLGGTEAINGNAAGPGKRTTFTTAVPNVTISSVDYYLHPDTWLVLNLVLGLYDANNKLIFTSPTSTTQFMGSSPVKITSVFNYTLKQPGTYSIGVVSGSGSICVDESSKTYPITEPTGTVAITRSTFGGKAFNNIQFSVITSTSNQAPVPNTNYVGTATYYVTQSNNGCESPASLITVNVNGITSVTSNRGCSGQRVTLNATASPGYDPIWYDSPTSGSGTKGTSFQTPTLYASKTYYVAATDGTRTSSRVPVMAIIGGYRWQGNNGASWTSSSSWNSCTPGSLPPANGTADIIIPSTAGKVVLDSDVNVKSLTLQGTSKVDLNGHTLTVSSLTGTGSVVGSKNSSLVLNGTENTTLRFDQTTPGLTNALKVLTINGNSRSILLDNPLLVSGVVNIPGSSVFHSNDNLTLESTSTSNASIGPLLNGAAVLGNVKVQAFMRGSSPYYRSFRTIASPVFNISSPAKAYRISGYKNAMIVTGPGGTDNGFDPSPNNGHTIKFYNEPKKARESQYLYPANATTEAVSQGKGLYFYFRGNKQNPNGSKFSKVNGSYATPEDVTMEYYGQINSGNISPVITYTNHPGEESSNGFNLIGNPYPSTIDWNSSGIVKNNIDNTIWVQRQDGTFAILEGIASTNGGSRYILPGQGFFVKANGPNPSITFTEGAKVPSAAPPTRLLSVGENETLSFSSSAAKTGKKISSGPANFNLKLIKDEFASDETAVVFVENSDKGFDTRDIAYMGEGAVTLTTITPDNQYLAINYTPESSQTLELGLYAGATESGSYTLKLSAWNSMNGMTVFLKDAYQNTTTDLLSQSEYSFEIDKSKSASFGSNRFKLLVQPASTLPVSLKSFSATSVKSGVQLKWETASERDNEYFELEHSVDGKSFYALAKIEAAGTSSNSSTYQYLDENAVLGQNYYRLKQVDADGNFSYSGIVSANLAREGAVVVYPNPVSKELRSSVSGASTINVYNLNGVKVLSSSGSTLDVSSLLKGLYIAEVLSGSGNEVLGRTRFIKN